ncbi:MAG TPA: glycine cleavage T C-terminal barrel domain-containing protein [Candidatus Binataceae bacterium]|nr:glycine cleavage T C-terminal barrel domain-containing protein [Candidatus Binataceae bacterium]
MTTLQKQYDAVPQPAGVARLDDRLVVRVTGDDRVSFMHGMCSQDIQNLHPGMAAPALLLTEHAHIVADFFVYATEDELLIEIERSLWPQARAHLEKFLVADDVEFEELDSLAIIDVEGPAAVKVVAAIDAEPVKALKEWRHFSADSSLIASIPRFGVPAYTILAKAPTASNLIVTLLHSSAGTEMIEPSALELLRLENSLARVGVDTTDKTLALEACLERAISFNKGCYIGQETVERATARGGIKKRLCSLMIDGNDVPPSGSSVFLDGKEVGRLTSVLRSARFGIIGLGILHHSAWESGTALMIRDGEHGFRAVVR